MTMLLLAMVAMLVPAIALAEGQSRFDRYTDARISFWNEVYVDGGDTLYCGEAFLEPTDLTIEHVFPISWMAVHFGCASATACRERSPGFNRMEADLHNLWPARIDAETLRDGKPFGAIPGGNYALAGCGLKIFGIVDPRAEARGDIARTILYMSDAYGAELPQGQRDLMTQWDREDPPDAAERNRNDRIEAIQGTRNHFIDAHLSPGQ
jgi:deoxyribonuclease-1